jgi:hypothetical protein
VNRDGARIFKPTAKATYPYFGMLSFRRVSRISSLIMARMHLLRMVSLMVLSWRRRLRVSLSTSRKTTRGKLGQVKRKINISARFSAVEVERFHTNLPEKSPLLAVSAGWRCVLKVVAPFEFRYWLTAGLVVCRLNRSGRLA